MKRGIYIDVIEQKPSPAPKSGSSTIATLELLMPVSGLFCLDGPQISFYKRKKVSVSGDIADPITSAPSSVPPSTIAPNLATNLPPTLSCAPGNSISGCTDIIPATDPIFTSLPESTPDQPFTSLISLAVETSIEDMTHNWSLAEVKEGRRLVHFTVTDRAPDGSRKAHVSTADADQCEICAEKSAVLSCIARPSRVYIIASVDLLRLASLLYGRSTTWDEEGNLRSLQRLEPVTVRKKSDSYRLFRRLSVQREVRCCGQLLAMNVSEYG